MMSDHKKTKKPFDYADNIISEFPQIKVIQYDQKEDKQFFNINFLQTKGVSSSRLSKPISKPIWYSSKTVVPDQLFEEPPPPRKLAASIIKLSSLARSLSSEGSPPNQCAKGVGSNSFRNNEVILNDFIGACESEQFKNIRRNTRTISMQKKEVIKSQCKLRKILAMLNSPGKRKDRIESAIANDIAHIEAQSHADKKVTDYQLDKLNKLHDGKIKIWKMTLPKSTKHSIL